MPRISDCVEYVRESGPVKISIMIALEGRC